MRMSGHAFGGGPCSTKHHGQPLTVTSVLPA